MDLLLRNVEIRGRGGLDVLVSDGVIVQVGAGLRSSGLTLDGGGGALIPGLADHHIHLLATAARADTVDLAKARGPDHVTELLRTATSSRPVATWVRAAGYHERHCGAVTRDLLDRIAPDHPVRVEHQSGSLWILNSPALEIVATADAPDCVERDAAGRATGQVWRGEDWLRRQIGQTAPDLAALGARLSALGLTEVMDASRSTDASAAGLLAEAHRNGHLPQRLGLMSGGPLEAPDGGEFVVGPVKFLLDEHELPDLDQLAAQIVVARQQGRQVAFHCVTYGELAYALAALDIVGSGEGDRIEHGGLIPAEAIPELAARRLTIVTQPGFIHSRGERYLQDVEPEAVRDLYRCASLLRGGAALASSSDAPYGNIDPWASMRTAVQRQTRNGKIIGADERVTPEEALRLHLGALANPGGPERRIEVGARADLCLLSSSMRDVLRHLDAEQVTATAIGGRVVYRRD